MFHYEAITTDLVEAAVDQLNNPNRGTAVVGPRYGGKRNVLLQVAERLRSQGREVSYACVDDFAGQDLGESGTFLGYVAALKADFPAVLLVADIDNLRETAWRTLIEKARPLLKEQRLQLVLSGGPSLVEWLQADDELSAIESYVVHGLGLTEFKELGNLWCKRTGFALADPEHQLPLLWQWMGGSQPLLTWWFYLLMERRVAAEKELPDALDDVTLRDVYDKLVLRGVRWAPTFSRVSYEIRRSPGVWTGLENLLRVGAISGVDPNGAPTALELSGLAKRTSEQIEFASEAMRTFAAGYFDARRLGDFQASQGKWRDAFDYFSRRETQIPPYYFDRSEAKSTTAGLCERLLYESGKSVKDVHDCFVDICRDYFRVQLWVTTWNGRAWNLTAQNSNAEFRQEWLDKLSRLQASSPGQTIALFEDPAEGVCIVVGDRRPGWLNAYILTGQSRGEESASRRGQFRRIVGAFAVAYGKAIEREDSQTRLKDVATHRDILAELMRMISGRAGSADLCRTAAERLRVCGYKRVLICLVDHERTHISGVWDASPDRRVVDVAKETHYPLSNPDTDVQPFVVENNSREVILDALSHRLINKSVARRAGMRSLAVIPIPSVLNRDLALGTIHIERSDLGCPTEAELDDLDTFAVGFAGALQLAERTRQWEALINRIPEPVFYKRFTHIAPVLNQAAEDLKENAGGAIPREIEEGLLLAANKQRNIHFASALGPLTSFPAMITSDRLQDSRGSDFGCFSLVKDFSRVQRVFDVYTHIAAAENFNGAVAVLFDEFRRQGFSSGRLYLITTDGDSLHLENCFYRDPVKQAEVFAARESVRLPKRSEPAPNLHWKAINSDEPIILQYKPGAPHGTIWSAEGLPITVCPELNYAEFFDRHPDSYAIEIPLLGVQGAVGKITLDGAPSAPEDFQLYRLLTHGCRDLFYAFLNKDRRSRFVMREQAEQLLREALHNINSRFAPIGHALAEYRELEDRMPALKTPDLLVERAMDSISTFTEAVARAVSVIRLNTTPVNLAVLLKPMAKRTDVRLEILPCKEDPTVEADAAYLEGVFAELIKNSVEAFRAPDATKVPTIRLKFEFFMQGEARRRWLRTWYSDDGPGIRPEDKQRIFEPWSSGHISSTAGRGLGLSYVGRVIGAHAGHIKESGQFGQGALFIIDLPEKRVPQRRLYAQT